MFLHSADLRSAIKWINQCFNQMDGWLLLFYRNFWQILHCDHKNPEDDQSHVKNIFLTLILYFFKEMKITESFSSAQEVSHSWPSGLLRMLRSSCGIRLSRCSCWNKPSTWSLLTNQSPHLWKGALDLLCGVPVLNQKVLCNRQWQPQPAGHSSWQRNQSIMWLVCPPWPQVRQKLDEPRTATWQIAHWNVRRLQTAHCVPRAWLRQWQQ